MTITTTAMTTAAPEHERRCFGAVQHSRTHGETASEATTRTNERRGATVCSRGRLSLGRVRRRHPRFPRVTHGCRRAGTSCHDNRRSVSRLRTRALFVMSLARTRRDGPWETCENVTRYKHTQAAATTRPRAIWRPARSSSRKTDWLAGVEYPCRIGPPAAKM